MVVPTGFTEWIAGTQRLLPEQVTIQNYGSGEYVLQVPSRSAIWYWVFFVFVWGMCGTVCATFWFVADEPWVRAGVVVASLFVGLALSIEQRFAIQPENESLIATIRFSCVPFAVASRRLPFDSQSRIEATKSRDVEGLRQVQLIVRDGNRTRDVLLSFAGGWDCYDSACELAKRINELSNRRGQVLLPKR